jgi:hypothetical protein
MFQRITVPPYSGSSITAVLLGLLDPENEDTTILQNLGHYSPINTASHATSGM